MSTPSSAPAELDRRIRAAISTSGELWFPGLAAALVNAFFAEPGVRVLAPDYGTARWIARDAAAPRECLLVTSIAGKAFLIEHLPPSALALPEARLRNGLSPADADTLHKAIAIIETIPTLAETIGALVRTLHTVNATPGFDVSLSDPEIPFSIFASIPGPHEPEGAARLAESIIHEAMHLQLSLIERSVPLISGEHLSYSPWKKGARPAGGLLHGVYVFVVISQALRTIGTHRLDCTAYADRRSAEIRGEISAIERFESALTDAGRTLHAQLIQHAMSF